MKRSIGKRNPDEFPAAKQANAGLHKIFFALAALGLVLPFLLPESPWLVASGVFQLLSEVVPSARKMATVAQSPNVVHAYIVIMLVLSAVCGGFHFIFLKSHREYLQAEVALSAPRGLWFLWFKALGGIIFFATLIALFYILPGEVTADPRGSRGQLLFSLMVMTKPGLAATGAFIACGLAAIWFVCFYAVYGFFRIPFLIFQSNHQEQP